MELGERRLEHDGGGCRHTGAPLEPAPLEPAPLESTPLESTPSETAPLADLRFRALLGAERWTALPRAVRRRFGKRLDDARTVTYTGHIVECRMSGAGWLLAQLLRPIGGPLPTSRDTGVPAAVVVTEDEATGGQFWTRVYGRHSGFPRVIGSSKRFRGPTGLEEYIGHGIGMALAVSADERALHFDSDHYFLAAGPFRWRLPGWLTPGALRVSHVDRGAGRFEFVLALRHPLLGELVRQSALFADAPVKAHPRTRG